MGTKHKPLIRIKYTQKPQMVCYCQSQRPSMKWLHIWYIRETQRQHFERPPPASVHAMENSMSKELSNKLE